MPSLPVSHCFLVVVIPLGPQGLCCLGQKHPISPQALEPNPVLRSRQGGTTGAGHRQECYVLKASGAGARESHRRMQDMRGEGEGLKEGRIQSRENLSESSSKQRTQARRIQEGDPGKTALSSGNRAWRIL